MSNTDRKAVIKNADMTDDMTQDAIDVANQVIYPNFQYSDKSSTANPFIKKLQFGKIETNLRGLE